MRLKRYNTHSRFGRSRSRFIELPPLVRIQCTRLLVKRLGLPSSLHRMTSTHISPSSIVVPEDHTLHRENSAFILLPSENGAFLNTVQEFNRDLSVACIRTWSERHNRDRELLWNLHKGRQGEKMAARDAKRLETGENYWLQACSQNHVQ